MHWIKGLVYFFSFLHLTSLFFPWVGIESRGVEIGGFASAGTTVFGKPGLFHLVLTLFFLVLISYKKPWSKRAAYFFGALNIAWAVRNYILISACSGGICPEKYTALYVLLFSSLLMMVAALFEGYGRKVDPF
ncbi:MAG: hypothetical protein H0U44_10180 [Flavisolibacter sp.]|jgi:hypothetical protein|nr:hypothetical protein [Flavisolibacter sp.]